MKERNAMNNGNNKIRKALIVIILVTLLSLIGFGSYLMINYSLDKKKNKNPESPSVTTTFKDRVYTLPKGWMHRNYEESGTQKLNLYNTNLNAQTIIAIVSRDIINYNIDKLKNITSLEKFLNENDLKVQKGVLKTYHGKKVAVFQYEDMLLAYLNAYDNNLYAVRIIAGKYTDTGEERIFNYDVLEKVIAILNTAQEVK